MNGSNERKVNVKWVLFAVVFILRVVYGLVFADVTSAQCLNDEKTPCVAQVTLDTSPEKGSTQPKLVEVPLYSLDGEKTILSGSELFRRVGASVVYIQTPSGSGSGVLIEPGYLLTNAHVVWPYESVRVVAPDGREYLDVPVTAWDLVADMAILTLPETDLEPLALVDGTDVEIGSRVYLVGYPGETEEYPQPAITQGILSRLRTWNTLDLTLLQVDANVSGGQSGGIVVTERGELVGMTTFSFTSARYGLAISSFDIAERLQRLLNEPGFAYSDRRPLQHESGLSFFDFLSDDLDEDVYVLQAESARDIELRLRSKGEFYLDVVDGWGYSLFDTEPQPTTDMTTTVSLPGSGIYYVSVAQEIDEMQTYHLLSSVPLIAVDDADDGKTLEIGSTTEASIDTPLDVDRFILTLQAGEKVVIDVDSMMVDTFAMLIYRSEAREEVSLDDDGGDGVFGLNSRIVYEAPADGDYHLLVFDSIIETVGGYYLSVQRADADDETSPLVFERSGYQTPDGWYWRYETASGNYEIHYPAEMEFTDCDQQACMRSKRDSLVINEFDLKGEQLEGSSLTSLVDSHVEGLERNGVKLDARSAYTTSQGLAGELLHWTIEENGSQLRQLIYLSDDQVFFIATYWTPVNLIPDMDRSEDIFSTFRMWTEESESDPAS